MATVVLSVVGGAVGGPIGAMLGAAVGGVIDRDVLFRPPGVHGPRLTALQLQTSSYGTPLQQVFGTMRVGGCVIWSTELIESSARSSSGKGQPSVTSSSYAASFAVALSGRPIVGVGRIWADGKILRGSGGDFKSATGFRLYLGAEDQPVDPLIAAAEGAGLAPAHRGIAYAVFEHFQLADYGNRIPSLTFEVRGDAAPVSVGEIAQTLSDGAVGGAAAGQLLDGFAAYGDSVASVLDTLAHAGGAWFAPTGGELRMRADPAPERAIADTATRSTAAGLAGGAGNGASQRAVAALETVPRHVTLSHYDPAREYQIGLQSAHRPGAGRREERVELPAAIAAGTAKTLAAAILARGEAGRERRRVTLGWDALDIAPGACVSIAGVAGVWRVSGWSLEHMVLSLECVRLAGTTRAVTASAGRVLAAPDLPIGATLIEAFESVALDDSALGSALGGPRVTIVAAGTQPGWRRAALLYSIDDGARWTAFGTTAAAATIGRLVSVPGPASSALCDRRSVFEVDLAHAAMALQSADGAARDAGANLALVGDELLQFAVATQLGPVRWRLATLWRGRRGTEAAMSAQNPGDRFVLIEPECAVALDLPLAALGRTVRVLASGVGDAAAPVATSVVVRGSSVVPPSPVQLTWRERDDGAGALSWTRRSRGGWHWLDGVDAPLGEEREAYRVTLSRNDTRVTTIETALPRIVIASAERAPGMIARVTQIGAFGESAGATLALPPPPAWQP